MTTINEPTTTTGRRLLAVLAHPDDETLGLGGTLAKYTAEGAAVYLLTATRGEKGWGGSESDFPGSAAFGRQRESELRAAAAVLGLAGVDLLDYIDGELDAADAVEAIRLIAAYIRRIRPQVVVTFGQDGIYGHPDHIATTQYVTSAVVLAASADADIDGTPHQIDKLYYSAASKKTLDAYEAVMGELVMPVDGVARRSPGWPDWSITTILDATPYWETVWQAAQCHSSQLPDYEGLRKLTPAQHEALWGWQELYRVFSLVNGGREIETDIFAGASTEDVLAIGAVLATTGASFLGDPVEASGGDG